MQNLKNDDPSIGCAIYDAKVFEVLSLLHSPWKHCTCTVGIDPHRKLGHVRVVRRDAACQSPSDSYSHEGRVGGSNFYRICLRFSGMFFRFRPRQKERKESNNESMGGKSP